MTNCACCGSIFVEGKGFIHGHWRVPVSGGCGEILCINERYGWNFVRGEAGEEEREPRGQVVNVRGK